MSSPEQYDLVVFGSGEAGKYIAWHMASSGKKTAVIERKYIGGSCPNIACLPSKNIVHSAKVASYFRRGSEFGISADHWHVDMSAVRENKRKMVQGLVDVHLANFRKSGAEIVMGSGRFIGEKTIEVTSPDGTTRTLHGAMVIISTGTRASINAIPGLAESAPMTHIEALELDVVPKHLVVLGGGYVGLEFAHALRRFGSRVTVVERSDRLLPREDPDVSEAMQALFHDEGIEVVTQAAVNAVKGRSGEQVTLEITRNGTALSLEASHLLVATGRTPNTQNIGLELAGVKTTDHDYIQVNERLQTTAPGVWAVGDCANSPHFTHIAFDDFRIVRETLAGRDRVTTNRQVPSCMFTDPELARIGLNETEAKQKGIAYRLAKVPMMAVLRTRTLSETRGFLKALISTQDDRILGFTGFGTETGELLAPIQLAMNAGLPYTALRDLIVTHPTISEGLVVLFSAVPPI